MGGQGQSVQRGIRGGAFLIILLALAGCGSKNSETSNSNSASPINPVTDQRNADSIVVDNVTGVRYHFIGQQTFENQIQSGKIARIDQGAAQTFINHLPKQNRFAVPAKGTKSIKTAAGSVAAPAAAQGMLLGFPVGLLGEESVFGAVITKVSDRENDDLGMLKLTDLTPLHVRALVAQPDPQSAYLVLVGCASQCSESAAQSIIIGFPIMGVDEQSGSLVVDLAVVGKDLNLVQMLDPSGAYTGLKSKVSRTSLFDYSLSTLVFDVESDMIPVKSQDVETAPVTTFTVRWYMRLNSGFNTAFESRAQNPSAGYFTTERSANPKIIRHALTNIPGQAPVHYYIKNVPQEYQSAFQAALDEWNQKFKAAMGRDLISYQFVDPKDRMNELLVAGDVRFNIIEWDLINQAPYGGLGPSIANQSTGEILTSNTLIQGPTIVEIYTKWFKVNAASAALKAQGRLEEADALQLQFHRQVQKMTQSRQRAPMRITIGDLAMRITSQTPELSDPLFEKKDFDAPPVGLDYATYMKGYFQEMVAHEVGHNLGLRHNFRGNLGSADGIQEGKVSRSIMEYMGRLYRHMNRISEYDVMAINYGYFGQAPQHDDWFCTDENVASAQDSRNSAECSRDDASADPYSFYEQRLTKAVDLIVNRASGKAPTWTIDDIKAELGVALTGLANYHNSATNTAKGWTNFFGKAGRPQSADSVRSYVIQSFEDRLCESKLNDVLAYKESAAAQQKTMQNLVSLRKEAAKTLGQYKGLVDQISCLKSAQPTVQGFWF